MVHLFRTRVFIAAALMLLLGAVRCINACQIVADPPAAAKSCHKSPDVPEQPNAKACSELHLVASDAPDPVEAPVVSAFEYQSAVARQVSLRSKHPAPVVAAPPLIPLRI